MKNNDINSLVLEYLKGGLTAGRERILKSKLIKHGYEIDELDALRETWQSLGDVSVPSASDRMTDNFYRMLSSYKREAAGKQSFVKRMIIRLRKPNFQKYMIRAAAGIVLLFIGFTCASV